MIKFVCGSCGERLSVPDKNGGRKGVCPTCQAINRIPLRGFAETQPNEPVVARPGVQPVRGSLSIPALTGRRDEPELLITPPVTVLTVPQPLPVAEISLPTSQPSPDIARSIEPLDAPTTTLPESNGDSRSVVTQQPIRVPLAVTPAADASMDFSWLTAKTTPSKPKPPGMLPPQAVHDVATSDARIVESSPLKTRAIPRNLKLGLLVLAAVAIAVMMYLALLAALHAMVPGF